MSDNRHRCRLPVGFRERDTSRAVSDSPRLPFPAHAAGRHRRCGCLHLPPGQAHSLWPTGVRAAPWAPSTWHNTRRRAFYTRPCRGRRHQSGSQRNCSSPYKHDPAHSARRQPTHGCRSSRLAPGHPSHVPVPHQGNRAKSASVRQRSADSPSAAGRSCARSLPLRQSCRAPPAPSSASPSTEHHSPASIMLCNLVPSLLNATVPSSRQLSVKLSLS